MIIHDCPNAACRTPIFTGKCLEECIRRWRGERKVDEKDIAEQAYRNGYDKGYEDGKKDAVGVVRCKDCKHWKLIDSLNPHWECQIFHGLHEYGYLTNADDFCSYGERREGE